MSSGLRLGLDIGTNSIGWWLYELNNGTPARVVDGGVRIFSDGRDPESKQSLAVERRTARAARRRRDRYLRRRASLMRKLADAGLMPSDPAERKKLETLDPYELRARGLDERLDLPELGRALFHLNQRRGFKSNRKTDRGDNKAEAGKIAEGTARLEQEKMAAGARTYGEFLHKRRAAATDKRLIPAVRTRMRPMTRKDGKTDTGYDFYPGRSHLEEEFNKLWEAQKSHHSAVLTDGLYKALFETIFYQRPLKAPEVGRCLFNDEKRLAKAHPLFQRRVLYETVNHLRIHTPGQKPRPLSFEERELIILKLDAKRAKTGKTAKVTFEQLRRALKLAPDESFHSREDDKKIACDAVRTVMAHKDCYGPRWSELDIDTQWNLIRQIKQLRKDSDEDEKFLSDEDLLTWLKEDHGLSEENAVAVSNASLPDGYGNIGLKATKEILERLKAKVITWDKAASSCGYHHSDFRTGEILDKLPYYGKILDRHVVPDPNKPKDDNDDVTRYGRISNPTVHIGLNQIRRIVNKIIEVYGLPEQIVLEFARELKLSKKQKEKIQEKNKANRKANDKRRAKLDELRQEANRDNLIMLRLWEEQDRRCPYSGKQIGIRKLFSGECEVDHILPKARTLDNSLANRIVCFREANREKGNRSPFEAWGHTDLWEDIKARVAHLPKPKQRRFAEDAMERFEDEKGFLARQLPETQYLSKIAREYLSRLYPEKGESHVWVVSGELTGLLRKHWGLKEKDRTDHRHHAIDAAIVGATDPGLIQRIHHRAAKRGDRQELKDVVGPPPWDQNKFRSDVGAQLDRITVSHRADHGRTDFNARAEARKIGRDSTTGQLHRDTAYGLTDEVNSKGVSMVVNRKPLESLREEDLTKIRDPNLRLALEQAAEGAEEKELPTIFGKFSQQEMLDGKKNPYRGIRRVRLIKSLSVIEIRNSSGHAYKGYKGDSNHCFEIWRMPDGKWERVVYSTFETHQSGIEKRPHPAAKRLMRLHKKDMIALKHPKHGPMIAVIAQLSKIRLDLFPHMEADADRRKRDKNDEFDYVRVSVSTLQKSGARRVLVDEIGRVRDPGPFN